MATTNDPGQMGPPPPPPPAWAPAPAGGTQPPRPRGTRIWWWIGGAVVVLALAAVIAVLVLAKPKSTPTATRTSPTASPTGTATTAPTTTATAGGVSGGTGDTSANPDSTFICADSASESGKVIAYSTVAGTDSTQGKTLCSDLETGGAWVSITTIAAGSYEATPGCYLTTADGAVTARVYTATAGDATTTSTLCTELLTAAHVTPSP